MTHPPTIRTISLLAILVVFVMVMYAIVPKYANNLKTSLFTPSSIPVPSPISPRTLAPEEQAVLNIPLHYAPSEQKIQHA